MLGTAYDVFQRKKEGTDLPWYLYLNDFINILPPQQILPFEKVAASEWYLREIGLSGTGLGFMWGVITQSIVGLDWIEIALRGGILGFLLAKIHSWYARNSRASWQIIVCLSMRESLLHVQRYDVQLSPIFRLGGYSLLHVVANGFCFSFNFPSYPWS